MGVTSEHEIEVPAAGPIEFVRRVRDEQAKLARIRTARRTLVYLRRRTEPGKFVTSEDDFGTGNF